jgi:hypothetical protein
LRFCGAIFIEHLVSERERESMMMILIGVAGSQIINWREKKVNGKQGGTVADDDEVRKVFN